MLEEVELRLNEWLGSRRGFAMQIGADHFLVVHAGSEDLALAEEEARVIREVLSLPMTVGNAEFCVDARIGVLTAQATSGRHATNWLRNASIAATQAKATEAGVVRFSRAFYDETVEHVAMERDLRRAVQVGQIRAAYQPLVSLDTSARVGLEALARWRHPYGYQVPPAKFIPVAEETGLIRPLGEGVLQLALEQVRRLRARQQDGSPYVSVNVSKRQLLEGDPVTVIERALEASGEPPAALQLEVTESVVMARPEEIGPVLSRIKDMGVGLALDDFGVGQSSLHCIHCLPFDVLKVDRSFLRSMVAVRDLAAVMQSVITMAHNLGMKVVAEGVETAEQVALLQALECDYGQGFYFGRPAEAPDLRNGYANMTAALLGAGGSERAL